MRKKGILFCLSLLLLSASLHAAGAKEVESAEQPAAEQKTAIVEEEILLAAPRDLTPGENFFHPASVICYTWEPLVSVDKDWNPVPKLAKSWEMSDDAMEWTFYLREDVTFHDGEKFNADAVMANFSRYQKTPGKSKFYSFSMKRFYPNFKNIEKLGEYSVKLSFEKPMPTIVYYMTNFGSPMHSPKSFDADGNFTTTPAGTGPFKLVEHVPDEYAVLERFANYYGPKAKAKRIKIKVIPDGNTRFAAMRSEEIMGVMDFGAMQPNLAKELIKDNRFSDSRAKNSIIHYIAPNGTKFPFNDLRMKQAVSLMIDRQVIADEFYAGYAVPASGILNYASPFYKKLPVEHNPEKAKKLALEVLGNKRVSIDLITPSAFIKKFPYKEQCEYVQAVLKDLGLDVEIKIMEMGALKEAMKTGNYGLCMRIQGLPNGEPLGIYTSFMGSEGGQNKSYSLGYKSEEVDTLLARLDQTIDIKERAKIYNKLQEISARELPFIPLMNDASLIVYNKKITDYEALIYGGTLPTLRWSK